MKKNKKSFDVTVFIPLFDGLFDKVDENGPHVYHGRLTKEQIVVIGKQLGDRYSEIAVEVDGDGWFLTYSNMPSAVPDQTGYGDSFFESEHSGELTYLVVYRKVIYA